MEDTLPLKIIVLAINAIGIWLGVLINIHRPRSRLAFLFTGMVFLMFMWVDFAYLARVTPPVYGLLFIKLAWAVTPFFFVLIYLFIKELLKERNPGVEKILSVLGIVNIPVVFFTPFIIENIWFDERGILRIKYGEGEWIFFGEVLFFTLISFITLFKKFAQTLSLEERRQIFYILVGFSFFFLMNAVFNIICPVFLNIFHLYELGDYSTIVLLSFVAYAVVRERLFEIKVFLTEIFVGIIAILFLIEIFEAKTFWDYIWKSIVFLLFVVFGYFLTKSVMQEIKRRRELTLLNYQLEDAEKKLRKAYQELQQLDKAKSEFISIASHQLRTPLTAIKGYLSMILEGSYGKVPKKLLQPLKNVYFSAERLIKLVNYLLNISRIEAGKVKLEPEKTAVEEVIESVIFELQPEVKEKGIYLKFEKPKPPLPPIMIDRDKFRQVILNLVDNAIKYTQKGGIKVTLEKKNSHYLVKVKDTGEGMTKEEISSLFKSFSRGKAGSALWTEGAGLGLYVAKKFVDMHKGKIWAESEGIGKGSTFFVEIPAKRS